MILGVLLCDDVRPELQQKHGNYPAMFSNLFGQIDPAVELRFYRVIDGQYPGTLDECDAYISSGSKFSVNDEIKWVSTFEAFAHQLYRQPIPFIGICFGHQMIARALGGEVCRSDNGWGIGVARTHLKPEEIDRHSWLTDAPESYSLLVSHQEQIIELPENSLVLAGSEFCPYAMIQVGSHFLGIQGHPEFTPEYTRDLINVRRHCIPPATVQTALASLHQQTDSQLVGRWILNFIRLRTAFNHS